MSKRTINPADLFNSLQYGFSQIVVSQGSKQVHVSGQVAWDQHGQIIGKNDLGVQTMAAFENLERAMRHAGGSLEDVVSLRIYIVQSVIDQDHFVAGGLRRFFPQNPPASTWIAVPALSVEDFLIEIEAFAVLN